MTVVLTVSVTVREGRTGRDDAREQPTRKVSTPQPTALMGTKLIMPSLYKQTPWRGVKADRFWSK
jgi:hypothetical protein